RGGRCAPRRAPGRAAGAARGGGRGRHAARGAARGRDGPPGGAARALGARAARAAPRPGRARRRARQRPPPRPRGELRRGRCAPPRALRLAAPGRRHRRRDPDHGRRPRGRVPAARGAEAGPGSELVRRLAAWLATLSARERTLVAAAAAALGLILVAGAIFAGVVALTFPTDALVHWALARALPPGGPRLDFDHATLRPWGMRLAPVTLRDAAGYRLAAADWLLAHPSLPGFLHDRRGRPWRATGAAYGGTFAALLGREATDLEWHDLDLARMPTLKVGGERLEGTTG